MMSLFGGNEYAALGQRLALQPSEMVIERRAAGAEGAAEIKKRQLLSRLQRVHAAPLFRIAEQVMRDGRCADKKIGLVVGLFGRRGLLLGEFVVTFLDDFIIIIGSPLRRRARTTKARRRAFLTLVQGELGQRGTSLDRVCEL